MKEIKTNFSSKLIIASKGMHNADKFSREQAFDKVNKRELRRMIQKRPPRVMSKEVYESQMLEIDHRTNN